MKKALFLSVLLSVFSHAVGTAQSENKTTILGCWEVRQVIFTKEVEGSDDISMDALTTNICFDADGKFSHKDGEKNIAGGNYSLSENGRTLSNKAASGNWIMKNIPGQIMMLSDRELQIQAEELVLYLRRGDE